MLFNVLLANITILSCFFYLFRVDFKIFLTISVEIEIARRKLALATPTGAPIIFQSDSIEMLPHATDKTIKYLSN